MVAGRGWWLTASGNVAKIVRLKSIGGVWFLHGAWVDGTTGVYVLTTWFTDGVNYFEAALDLVKEIEC
jgi:hypothetical protein